MLETRLATEARELVLIFSSIISKTGNDHLTFVILAIWNFAWDLELGIWSF